MSSYIYPLSAGTPWLLGGGGGNSPQDIHVELVPISSRCYRGVGGYQRATGGGQEAQVPLKDGRNPRKMGLLFQEGRFFGGGDLPPCSPFLKLPGRKNSVSRIGFFLQKPVKISNLRGEKLQISLAQYFPNKPFFRKLVGGKRKIIIDLQNLLLPGGVPNTIIYFTRQVDIGKFAL